MAARKGSSAGAASPARAPELVLTHVFQAPRELVFAAWTERQHLERWQGAPEGMTVTTEEADIRTGGRFRICMRSPDGAEHWLQGVYREVTPPERLVFTHAWLDADKRPGIETLVTITLTERGGATELTLRQTGFASEASRDGHREGWDSTLRRLEAYLDQSGHDQSRHGRRA
jgi:uncharacterized protein YndB with AHSA1/START domain